MNRRGMTLVELLIGIVIAAIVGGTLVRLVVGELRSVENQEAWRVARAVTRSGVNRLVSDLRMVEATGGVEAASAGGKDFTVRVPYAFGIVCATTGSATTVSLAPVDSMMYVAGGFSGFAWRDTTTGAYTYVTTGATLGAGVASTCTTTAGITTLTGGRVIQLGGTVPNTLPAGTVVFLFRRVRYQFTASTLVTGRVGLWRTPLTSGTAEELAAPFDTSARVRFYVLNTKTPQDAVPSPLSNTRGLELQLTGASEVTPRGSSAPQKDGDEDLRILPKPERPMTTSSSCETAMSAWSNRRGGTLPLTLLVIALLSMAVIAGFNRASGERRVNANQEAQVDAFTVAQSGLEQYLLTVGTMPGASVDTTITGLSGGSAAVSLRRLRDTIGGRTAVYVIYSRGINSTAKKYDVSAPAAERTVAQYTFWRKGSVDVDAAFTSLSGLDKNGNSGALDGNDYCGVKTAIPGVAVPNTLYSGHTNPINGNPDNTPSYIGTAGTAGTAKDAVRVDWNGIVNQNALPANFTGTWPTTTAQWNTWPVVRYNGDLNFPSDGKGILIVTGNLTISGNNQWDGIVLVGGTFTSNGNNTIQGALITGLNIKLGTTVAQTAVGNGNKTIQYNSCNIASALQSQGALVRISNGWMDNWPTW